MANQVRQLKLEREKSIFLIILIKINHFYYLSRPNKEFLHTEYYSNKTKDFKLIFPQDKITLWQNFVSSNRDKMAFLSDVRCIERPVREI